MLLSPGGYRSFTYSRFPWVAVAMSAFRAFLTTCYVASFLGVLALDKARCVLTHCRWNQVQAHVPTHKMRVQNILQSVILSQYFSSVLVFPFTGAHNFYAPTSTSVRLYVSSNSTLKVLDVSQGVRRRTM